MIGGDMYISSIEESLLIIGCVNTQEFKERYVYTIENGKIIDTKQRKSTVKKNTAFNHHTKNTKLWPNSTKKFSDTKDSVDLVSHWVKRTAESSKMKTFIKGNWYYFEEVAENGLIKLKNEQGTISKASSSDFSKVKNFNPGGYIVLMRDESKYFKSNEILHLIGLEYDKQLKDTVVSAEKLIDDEQVYTWGQMNFRAAEREEAENYLTKVGTKSVEDIEKDTEENKMFIFENDIDNQDADGNRLGNAWTEVQSVYESFMDIRIRLDEISESLTNVIESGKIEDAALLGILGSNRNSVIKLFDIAENEIESIFDRVYEMQNVD
jgi:hypothetical protein